MSSNIKFNLPNNYYGVTSFNQILSGSQKKNTSSLSGIYSAGSMSSQLSALTSAIGSLRSAAAGASDQKSKDAYNAKIESITTAMKNSFHVNSSYTYTAPDTRSLHEMAKENADTMLSKYNQGTKIDELI